MQGILKVCDLLEVTLECVHHEDPALCPINVEGKENNSQRTYYYKLEELADIITGI